MNVRRGDVAKLLGMTSCGVLLLLQGGCGTAGLQAGGSRDTASPYVIVDDPSFGNQVSIVRVAHDQVGELMRGTVTLQSNRRRSLQMQYRFSWYDSNGMEIDGGGQPFRDLIIEGRDTVTVSSVAPSPHAAEFKIRVRKVKAIRINNLR